MSKRSKKEEANSGDNGNAKRTRGVDALESDWIETLNFVDIADCKAIKSKLENLLEKAKERIKTLEEEEIDRGLNYDGEDKVECDCGNTFEFGGKYGAMCDECLNLKDNDEIEKNEKCIECVVKCEGCCGKMMCGDCKVCCTYCEEPFCNDCLDTCCCCHDVFCGRGYGYCQTLGVTRGGGLTCKGCVEVD